MTSYALITTDGGLSVRSGDWRAEIGPEGSNQVRLHPARRASGWVNDVGLLFPECYPRNVVGTIALICMGAAPQPYAGPVVITGWDRATEVGDLPADARNYLPLLVRDISLVLEGDPPETPFASGDWAAAVADIAAAIPNAPVAPARIVSSEDPS
ncbi:hypothetical protein [Actinomadura nitritigenes]|uniref:hypothetical protein n=1 Tax=Actinomadura nitritigenes TaxID=134602 RepID=UPI003D900D0E